MKLIYKTLSYLDAVQAVLTQLDLSPADTRFLSLEREDAFYRLVFRTDWMKYEAYVSAESGELLGLDQEPSVDSSCASGCRYEFLYSRTLLDSLTA